MPLRTLLVLATLFISANALAVPCPDELPTLLVVQDKSGSMAAVPDANCPTCPTKWASSKTAVTTLAAQFANRFRFGMQMYPRDATTFNCIAGTILSQVPASSAQLSAAYSANAPGGGTPTASSLDAARAYLNTLGITSAAPGYVLLLTDGLPNCNLSLDPNTCVATTWGCDANSCGLGSKDCLDDNGTVAAAGRLLSAGYKVYVVGFGSGVTADNNKAVLDRVAAAGGSGQAYIATNQASLTTALNTIAFDAATCCKDVCTAGAAQCTADGQLRECRLDTALGCTNWFTTTCPARTTCQDGRCYSCSDQCTLGAGRCVGDSAQRCQTGTDGCTAWVEVDRCAYGEICSGGTCGTCEGCALGDTRCAGLTVQTCTRDLLSGCTRWEGSKCSYGSVCQGDNCQACNQTCTAGAQRCAGNTPETCVADTEGCTSWRAGTPCADFCSGGACGACGTRCAVNEVRCNGNATERCVLDSNKCTVWQAGEHCAEGEYCSYGACYACPDSCDLGQRRCVGDAVETCRLQENGCGAWALTDCAEGEKCYEGACAEPCTDACTEGELRCDAKGQPQACGRAPTGCTVWMASTESCDAEQLCVEGVCRDHCIGGEIETCPPGFICTSLPEGRVCLPKDDTEVPTDPVDPGTDGTKPDGLDGTAAVAESGCGCTAGAGTAFGLLMAPLALAALRRRR